MQISFHRFRSQHLPAYRSWFTNDELARRLSYPTGAWLAHVTRGDTARCWAVISSSQLIGVVQVDGGEERGGAIALAVEPGLWGRSVGHLVLTQFLAGPGRDYPAFVAYVEPDHPRSLALFQGCGFQPASKPDGDGFIRMTYRRDGD